MCKRAGGERTACLESMLGFLDLNQMSLCPSKVKVSGTGQFLRNLKDLQGFAADPVHGRAKCLPMLGEIKTYRT